MITVFISKRVKRMVLDFATNALTLKHIAETCNVSDHTVQRQLMVLVKTLNLASSMHYRSILLSDEFKGVKHAEGNMSFMFIDTN